jgi:hypothetical protein
MNFRSEEIRQAARDEQCTLNSPWCNYNSETTVFCHLNEQFAGKGMGIKAIDIGFFACHACHDIYDRRMQPSAEYKLDEYFYLLRAVVRTLNRLIEKGILNVR